MENLPYRPKSVRVLVVDDHELMRKSISKVLRKQRFEEIYECSNGLEAKKILSSKRIDLVICDIYMGKVDGFEVLRSVRNRDAASDIPFIVVSGEASKDDIVKAADLGAEDYLLKPIRKEKLEKALNSAVTPNKAQLRQAEQKDNEERTHVCTTIGNTVKLIPVDSILYFHAEHKYVTLRYSEGSALIEEPLKKLEQEFSSSFLRIHRNALVAIKHVAGMARSKTNGNVITFNDADDVLEVSRRHLPLVRKALRIKGEHQAG